MIKTMLKKKKGMYIKVTPDQKGHHEPKHKRQASVSEAIENHIKSYGPSISHYRRKHAPNRLYLSPEFTASSMFNDFNERHPEHEIHYSTYYRAVRAMKISFVKLGEEECEMCDEHEHHLIDVHIEEVKELKKTRGTSLPKHDNCDKCNEYGKHVVLAIEAREHYNEDAQKTLCTNEIIMSVDLQKVMMLPRLPGLKKAIFCKNRLFPLVRNMERGSGCCGTKALLVGLLPKFQARSLTCYDR